VIQCLFPINHTKWRVLNTVLADLFPRQLKFLSFSRNAKIFGDLNWLSGLQRLGMWAVEAGENCGFALW
jgi:hypothetical protein